MNITFLVGNGFDKCAGLKTGYSDFYEWYCKQEPKTDSIREIKNDITNSILEQKQDKTDVKSIRWADLEYELGQCTARLFKNNPDGFIECFEDIHDALNQYILEENAKVDLDSIPDSVLAGLSKGFEVYYSELKPAEQKVFEALTKQFQSENCEFRFLSFNYTNVLDNCLRRISASPIRTWQYQGAKRTMTVNARVIHVHGRTGYYPILGVNDESQITNEDFRTIQEIIELLVKPSEVNAVGELWHDEAEQVINGSTVICVFGMSLGDTDAKWWSKIMKWLAENSLRQLIVFWHSKEVKNTVSIYRKRAQEQYIKDRLKSFSKLSQNALDEAEKRIHVVINTKKVLQCHLNAKPCNDNLDPKTEESIVAVSV